MLLRRRSLLFTAALAWPADAAEAVRVVCPLTAEPHILVPGVSDAEAARLLGSKIYRGLVRLDAARRPQPDMAARWDVSGDGRVYTFHLQPGMIWHDSGAVTADDAVFSLDRFHRQLQPGLGLGNVRQVRAADPLTVELTLAAADDDLLARLDAMSAPIVPQHVHDTMGFSINPRQTLPVGCGPLRVESWLRLARFEWYAGPKVGGLVLDCPILPNAATRLAAAQSGQPILLVGDAVDLASLPRLQADTALSVTMEPPLQPLQAGLRLNTAKPPLDNPAVRAALARAIDPAALVREAWSGIAAMTPGQPGLDLRAASAGLSAAGLRPDDEGVRLRLGLLIPQDAPWPQVAALTVAAWRRVGVEATTEAVPALEWTRRVAAGAFDVTGFAAPPDALQPGDLPLVDPGVPVVRDRRLHWTGSVFGSFAGAMFG